MIQSHHEPIEETTGNDDVIDMSSNAEDIKKDLIQETLEGDEPSKEETETDQKDANISRSE